jgi:hypothetical protein
METGCSPAEVIVECMHAANPAKYESSVTADNQPMCQCGVLVVASGITYQTSGTTAACPFPCKGNLAALG